MPKKLPPNIVEMLGQQLVLGLGRIAGRAAASAGKSVTRDIENAGKEVQRRARVAQKRLDELINPDDQEDEDDE
jgi:hypothetical protein